ncbi:molybdopterin-guanine dinucleotide biosynthesis protein B [Staphylococcus sp. SQ8-PEA]|uniref:Molybdopterin-guanine dinucleotide biosynthesis protein B n=1 Tax=Staphylococcus marylandisciuri TaxID=2981529 RepID=A0ABT2QMJ9_9STAP|nr:molybdopterin-guanine dinucleotide biosynthesis protein B [Staphylococcus marylandisciuri]MCU5745179.1 molybdopterin-guanine dinucleotide biosynthesis protein B [Staphylococcus marylandisciuri]
MIMQVVGYKDSGKTTLVEYIVKQAKKRGLTVVTIKHHGHQGEDITLQDHQVDHMKHFRAGADQSIVQGTAYQQTVTRTRKQNLSDIIDESVTIDNQLIVVEGFKQANYPKIIVYSTQEELRQLSQLNQIIFRLNSNDANHLEEFNKWLDRELEGLI